MDNSNGMHPNSKVALENGKDAEARIINAYNNGETGDFTVDVMRAVSKNDVVFGDYFNHGGRRHEPDGYVQVGRTMHIFEMKDGARYNEKYIGQVNRYAHVMNMFFDFDEVITYIIYGSRREVDVEVIKGADIHIVYAATRYTDDKAYNWKVDQRESMTDDDRDIENARSREYDRNRTHDSRELRLKQSNIRNGKRTPEQREAHNAKNRHNAAIRKANRTPEEVEALRAKQREAKRKSRLNAKRPPEEVAAEKAAKRKLKHDANRTLK